MDFFALHIQTGQEAPISRKLLKECPPEVRIFNPIRELMIRKEGQIKKEKKPLFPGYIFLEAEALSPSLLGLLKQIPGFYQVLPNNREIRPVKKEEIACIKEIFGSRQVARLSRAQFDENNRITIIDGPLKGKEGLIVKLNIRKGRAKIKIKAFDQEHFVDLGFELIENSSSN